MHWGGYSDAEKKLWKSDIMLLMQTLQEMTPEQPRQSPRNTLGPKRLKYSPEDTTEKLKSKVRHSLFKEKLLYYDLL